MTPPLLRVVAENVVTDGQTDRPSTVTLAADARRGLMTTNLPMCCHGYTWKQTTHFTSSFAEKQITCTWKQIVLQDVRKRGSISGIATLSEDMYLDEVYRTGADWKYVPADVKP